MSHIIRLLIVVCITFQLYYLGMLFLYNRFNYNIVLSSYGSFFSLFFFLFIIYTSQQGFLNVDEDNFFTIPPCPIVLQTRIHGATKGVATKKCFIWCKNKLLNYINIFFLNPKLLVYQ
jgi:hypothetical protein